MLLYAVAPSRRFRQVLGDLLFVGWVGLWVWVASVVRRATLALAAPGEQMRESANGLAKWFGDAAKKLGSVPLIGDRASDPFDGASTAATQLAAAGQAQIDAVHTFAFWLTLALVLTPTLIVAAYYVPMRVRFIRRAAAGRKFLDSAADLDLFALRAIAHQPLHVLAAISPDPAGAWRRQDEQVVRALATLELRDCGLALPSGT